MKKFLLSAAVASLALGASAQQNFVTNGDFEDTNYENHFPWEWDEAAGNLDYLPGWTLSGNDDWCVLLNIVEPEIDDEHTFEGNTQCLHIYRFDDNGWQAGGAEQVVTGLTANQVYTLGAIVARAGGETVEWDDPYFRIELTPLDDNGEEYGAGNLIDDKDDAICSSDVWSFYEKVFKAPASGNVRLRLSHNNGKWEGNHSEGFWMDIDDIAIMTPEDYEQYLANKSAGVSDISVAAQGQVLGVYNLRGVRVADNAEALGAQKGFFIVRTTDGAQKLVK